jgi:hypothetical protein
MKEIFLKYWFAVSAIALALLYFLYDRRGRQIGELQMDAKKQLLGQELQALQEQAGRSQEDYVKAMGKYSLLKLRHADLFKQLGISLSSDNSDKPGNGST